jgi:hypothetical protein
MAPKIPQYRGTSVTRTTNHRTPNTTTVERTNERGNQSTKRTQTVTTQPNGRQNINSGGRQTAPRERNSTGKVGAELRPEIERQHVDSIQLTEGNGKIGNNGQYSGKVTAGGIKSTSSASVQLSKDGLSIEASLKIDANVLRAQGEVERTFTINKKINGKTHRYDVKVKLAGEGSIGSDGEIKFKIDLTKDKGPGASVTLAGFAGAKASLTGTISVAQNHRELANTSAKMEIGLGVGAEGSVRVSPTSFEMSGKIYGGPGGGFELAGSIKPRNVAAALAQIATRTN